MNSKLLKTFSAAALTALMATTAQANLVVHEWGTFTSLVGSNGVTQNGMYHEDEPLPDFVHGFGQTIANHPRPTPLPQPEPTPEPQPPRRGRCNGRPSKGCFNEAVTSANKITQKMETPVLYFYADRETHVQVNVRFPEGVVTETYPGPISTFPSSQDNLVIANGNTTFDVNVLAPNVRAKLPYVAPENIYAHARNVASNDVTAGNEQERFIFYRGLGRFQPQIKITSTDSSLSIAGNESSLPKAAFLVDVSSTGDIRALDVQNEFDHGLVAGQPNVLNAERIAELQNHKSPRPFERDILHFEGVEQHLAAALVNAGLKKDEADAMIATWANGYLKVPGLRLLYILPRAEVDQVLPLQISPVPSNLTRVFVGRIEVMLQSQEQKILSEIETQGENFDVNTLGRFAEPMLRRLLESLLAGPTDFHLIHSLNHLITKATQAGADGSATSTTSVH